MILSRVISLARKNKHVYVYITYVLSMCFIISKLDVKKLKSSIIYSSNSENDCKSRLLDMIRTNLKINKVIENDYIMTYQLQEGYLYNNKRLLNIYQILEVKDKDE